jgi:uncharacterized membrane protein YfcA
MPIALMLALTATMVATAFVSGIFGMAGGLILIGVLLALLPVPEAMALHAVTQMASNGWRSLLWIKYVRWRATLTFLMGCALAFAVWSVWRYVPSKPVALILLGISPFIVRALPTGLRPDPMRLSHGLTYGAASMSLMLLTGVSGPMLDTYFLGGGLHPREIIATKAACQVANHGAKLVYFGGLVETAAGIDPVLAAAAVAASMVGTSLARPVVMRMSETQYRAWTFYIISAIGAFYLASGLYLLVTQGP